MLGILKFTTLSEEAKVTCRCYASADKERTSHRYLSVRGKTSACVPLCQIGRQRNLQCLSDFLVLLRRRRRSLAMSFASSATGQFELRLSA